MRSLSLVLVLTVGCSYAMRTLPDRPMAGVAYDCDDTGAGPIADSVAVALGLAMLAVTIVAQVDCVDGSVEQGFSTIGIGYFTAGGLIAAYPAARRGFRETRRCRAYHAGTLAFAPPPPAPVFRPDEVERTNAARGKACERIPGALHGGICPRGLVCRGDICVP